MKTIARNGPLPFLIAIFFLFLNGCLGASPSPRFYTLTPIPEKTAGTKAEYASEPSSIGIGPIRLADYLKQSKLVTRTGDNQVQVADFDHWAGSLEENFAEVVVENMEMLLPGMKFFIYPWRTSLSLDFRISLDVARLDGQTGESARLVVRWSLLKGEDKKELIQRRSRIQEPVYGNGYADLVAAQSRAVASLCREIADSLQAAASGRLPRP